jgi:hypothetical protein
MEKLSNNASNETDDNRPNDAHVGAPHDNLAKRQLARACG